MQAGMKICPLCGRSTGLEDVACPGCGHRYRTPFAPPLPQTQMGTLPTKPNSSFNVPTPTQPPAPAPSVPCAHCRQNLLPGTVVCGYCGADQRPGAYPVYAPPPVYAPMPAPSYQAQAYMPPPVAYAPVYAPVYAVRPPDDFEMFDLARQYRSTKQRFIWMLILGSVLFWPLLIVAYSDHKKMNAIKQRTALRGIHPEMWISSF